jgi:hypothetical protein
MRFVAGKGTTGFWDVEAPQFNIRSVPAWLKIDKQTGRLSGTPDTAGKAEVVVAVTLERDLRRFDGATLSWGNEKIISKAWKPSAVRPRVSSLTCASWCIMLREGRTKLRTRVAGRIERGKRGSALWTAAEAAHARISFATCPATSVRRKSRPA